MGAMTTQPPELRDEGEPLPVLAREIGDSLVVLQVVEVVPALLFQVLSRQRYCGRQQDQRQSAHTSMVAERLKRALTVGRLRLPW